MLREVPLSVGPPDKSLGSRTVNTRGGPTSFAGVSVQAGSTRVAEGSVAQLVLGAGPFAVRAPVRVGWRIDTPERVGFSYVTLEGHPVRGEEWFVVHPGDDGDVHFTISALDAGLETRTCGRPAGATGAAPHDAPLSRGAGSLTAMPWQ